MVKNHGNTKRRVRFIVAALSFVLLFTFSDKEGSKAGAGVVINVIGETKIFPCRYNVNDTTALECENQTIPAHAHNDYEHDRPLFEALEYHFKSIEADVFSEGDSLFVAHNMEDIEPGITLRQLYLEPLKRQISKNNGSVYGNGDEIILFIDIKDDGGRTYQLLHKILEEYKNEVSVFENALKTEKAILVVITGNRPYEFMQSQTLRYAGFDGRIEHLDSCVSSVFMPVVSDNWSKCFTWDGKGKMPAKERQMLHDYSRRAKSRGHQLRFWNTPNRSAKQRNAVWSELHDAGVGLIGADNLEELHQFFMFNKQINRKTKAPAK